MDEITILKEQHPFLFNKNIWSHSSVFGKLDEVEETSGYLFMFTDRSEQARFHLYLFNNELRTFNGYRIVTKLLTK